MTDRALKVSEKALPCVRASFVVACGLGLKVQNSGVWVQVSGFWVYLSAFRV